MRYFIDLAVYNKLDLHAFSQMEFGLDAWSELQANADMHCERLKLVSISRHRGAKAFI